MKLKTLIKLAEPKSFSASVLPVAFGSVLSWTLFNRFNLFHFLLLLTGMILVQAATNMINDYFDFQRSPVEADKVDEKALSSGETSPGQLKILIITLVAVAAVIGLYFTYTFGWWTLALMGVATLVMVTYSAGPLPLSHTPLGEAAAGLTMGLGITAAVLYIQSGFFSVTTVLMCLPTVFFIAALLLANNLADWREDQASGRKTTVVLLGHQGGNRLWLALMTAMLVLLWIASLMGIYPMILPLIVTLLHPYGLMVRFSDTTKCRDTKGALMGITTLIGLRYHALVMVVLMIIKVIHMMGY